MTELWTCPYCDYKGSEAWTHLMRNHIDIREQWDPNKQPRLVPVVLTENPKTTSELMGGVKPNFRTMHTITRRLEFDAGHRVYQHESKCNHVHGHRYVVEIECTGSLDELGRIVDFSVIKTKFGKWLDDNFDHGMVLFCEDPLVEAWECWAEPENPVSAQKYFVMDKNPTAENMAELFYKKANEMLADDGFTVTKMTVWETPNCRATYSENVS